MKRVVWGVAIMLAALGVVSGLARAVWVDDLIHRVEPARPQILAALGVSDPYVAERDALVQRMDRRFAENRGMTYTHVILGSAYLAFGLVQFSGTVRRRWLAYHRWAGRALVATGIVMALAGMYFGLLMPFSGPPEALVISLVGALYLFAIVRGFVAIRQRDRETHRRWMTRAYGIGLGIVVVRLIGLPADVLMTPRGFPIATTFVVTLWAGWGLTMLGVEWWLWRTRREARVAPSAVGAAA